MKKLVILILALSLFLASAALADEPDVVGCWAHYELLESGAPTMIMLYLAADHTCYYLNQMYKPDSEGFGRTFVGTWEMNSDGTVSVKTGDNARMELTFSDSYVGAMDLDTRQLFVNLSKYD